MKCVKYEVLEIFRYMRSDSEIVEEVCGGLIANVCSDLSGDLELEDGELASSCSPDSLIER